MTPPSPPPPPTSHTSRPVARALALTFAALFTTVNLRWPNAWLFHLPLAPFLALAALCVASPSARARLESAASAVERGGWRLVLGLAGAHFAVAAALTYIVFAGVPNIEDGNAYFFQAKLLSQGRAWVPDEGGDFFVYPWIARHDGRLFSMFPPGFPLLAAPGFWIGAPMVMPALHGAVAVVAVWAFAREVAGRARASYVAVLCAASPWALVMSASFMSHPAMLACTAGAGYFALRALRTPRYVAPSLAFGALAGAGFLVRPAEGLAVPFAFAAYALVHKGPRALPRLLLAAAAAAWGPLVYLAYNHHLLGVWGVDPLSLIAPAMRYGFGSTIGAVWPDSFPSPGHTPWRALLNANHNFAVLSAEAFAWPLPSTTFALVALFLGRRDRAWWASALLCAAITAVYAGYWYHGVCVGARFYFGMLPALALLTVSGADLSARAAARWLGGDAARARAFALALIAAMCAGGLTLYLPRALLLTPYAYSRGFRSQLLEDASRIPPGPAIVFVRRTDRHGASLILRNEWPLAQSPVIFAHDAGEARNRQLIARYPGRRVYYLDYRWPRNPALQWVREWLGDGLARPQG